MLRRMDRDPQFGRNINPLLVCIKMGISSGVVKYYFIFSELDHHWTPSKHLSAENLDRHSAVLSSMDLLNELMLNYTC